MNLFENPMIQKMFMGKATQLVKEHGIKAIVIKPDANGVLQFELHKEPVVILKQTEFDNMVNKITNG